VKICGGGRIIKNMSDVGLENIKFVRSYLKIEEYYVHAEDVGGIYPRKVNYNPTTGKLMVKKLRSLHNDTIMKREIDYVHALDEIPKSGEVELF